VSTVIALYSIIAAIWIVSPAMLPLMFDLRLKRKKKNSLGITTANQITEYTLGEKILFWVKKRLYVVFSKFLVRQEMSITVLAADLKSNLTRSSIDSKNLVSDVYNQSFKLMT
jgi:hypothetical protein